MVHEGDGAVRARLVVRTPDHEQFADMLHSGRAELVADRGQILFAFLARVVEDTDFDQFVAFETDADFMHDGF